MRHARQDWSVASYTYFFDDRLPCSLYFDLFAYDLRIFPLTHIFILIGIFWIEFFDVQVLNVGDCIGKSPGNILVMSYDNTGRAGKTYTDHIDITSYQVALKPD